MDQHRLKGYSSLIRHHGNLELFSAVEMSVAATANGLPLHLHVEGLRGTGKTSILRAARELLPPVTRIKGCLYNCDPGSPHCPEHRGLSRAALGEIGTESLPMPFLEVSQSAKIATVAGSLDLQAITSADRPQAKVLPGTLAQAHRGIIFIDEINRLAQTSPELADILLDAMGSKPGRVQIEEAGLPRVEIPLRVTFWAASNPDEDPGPLEEVRRQLSDRFDFTIKMGRPGAVEEVEAILGTMAGGLTAGTAMAGGQGLAVLPVRLRTKIAQIYLGFGLESLRAAEALVLGARACAARAGRSEAALEDLKTVLPLTLRHRVEPETLARIAKWLDEEGGSRECIAAAVASGGQSIPHREREAVSADRKAGSLLHGLSERFKTMIGGNGQGSAEAGAGPGEVSAPPRSAKPLRELDPGEWVNSSKDLIR